MTRRYEAPFVPRFESAMLDAAPKAPIDQYPWQPSGYRPLAYGQVVHSPSALHIRLTAHEENPRAEQTCTNAPVCTDSCLEIFLSASPGTPAYMNFELNARSTLLVGYGDDKGFHKLENLDIGLFQIRAGISRSGAPLWYVELTIPFAVMEQHLGAFGYRSGDTLGVNFYKCGDETDVPHYGCWNNVIAPNPDFHRPECFGELFLS